MTAVPGVIAFDAGYYSEASLTADSSVGRLIATGNRRAMGKAAAATLATGEFRWPAPGTR